MHGLSGSENRSVSVQSWWRRGGQPILPASVVALLLILGAAGPAIADILIGAVAPLSQPGDVAGGQEMKWALEQAVADVNAKGGVLNQKIRLIFYDTQNKPDVCASVAKRLVQEDKVSAVVGEFHSGCALAQIPTYNQAGMPVVFSETYNDKITAGDPADPNLPPNPPTVFRIAPTSTYYSGFIADWIVNGVKAKKVIQVVDTTDYGVGAASAMKEALGKAGVSLAQVSVELAQPDYASIMTRLKNENPDAEVVYYDVSETATAYVVMQNGIDVGLSSAKNICVGNPAMRDAQSYWRAVPNGVGCLFQLVGLTSTQFNEQAKSLDQRARQALGHEARNYAFEAYDSVLLVVDAIRRAGNTDAKAIVKALEQTSLVGTQGKYAFTYNSTNPVPKDKPGWLWHQYAEPPLQLLEFTKKGQTSEEAPTVWPASRQTQPGKAFIPPSR
jgi:branched-chain amino acid transport system substrate-binding protein